MSLAHDESEGEQMELQTLRGQLETTQNLVKHLSQQLTELKDQVSNTSVLDGRYELHVSAKHHKKCKLANWSYLSNVTFFSWAP
jgi:hypothetical protein